MTGASIVLEVEPRGIRAFAGSSAENPQGKCAVGAEAGVRKRRVETPICRKNPVKGD
jgi:hypothetical protein